MKLKIIFLFYFAETSKHLTYCLDNLPDGRICYISYSTITLVIYATLPHYGNTSEQRL